MNYQIKINDEPLSGVTVVFSKATITVGNMSEGQVDAIGAFPGDWYDIVLENDNGDILTMYCMLVSVTVGELYSIEFKVSGQVTLGGDNYKPEPIASTCPMCGAEL